MNISYGRTYHVRARIAAILRSHLSFFFFEEDRLNREQRRLRERSACPPSFILSDQRHGHERIPSFLLDTYQHWYGDLVRRLCVDEVILDYNYGRLFKCMDLVVQERTQRGFRDPSAAAIAEQLPLGEYAIALEFYLQVDGTRLWIFFFAPRWFYSLLVERFDMKTCSFRGARPLPSPRHGLFAFGECRARYGLIPCQRPTCDFCSPSAGISAIRRRRQERTVAEPVVHFSSAHKHRFVSGYEAILNCPAVSLCDNHFHPSLASLFLSPAKRRTSSMR